MVKQEELNTWDEFEKKVRCKEEETGYLKADRYAIYATSEVLYRGERNADWPNPLSSTWERCKGITTVGKYFDYVINNDIESSDIPISKLELDMLKQKIVKLSVGNINLFPTCNADTSEIISVMAELRHKGIPSPIVDWTSDHLVAAFFAFEEEQINSDRVAIFAFRHRTGYPADCKEASAPTVINIGPSIANPPSRHIKQKSQYTLCVKQNRGVCFKNAEFANILKDINNPGFIMRENGEAVDIPNVNNVLCKYTLPASEGKVIRKVLNDKDISRRSLGLS